MHALPAPLALLAFLAGCAADLNATPDDLDRVAQGVAVPGPWVIPPASDAIGNRQFVAYNGSALIASGGRCTSTNAFACSCTHPTCSRGLPGTLELAAFLRRRFPQIRGAGGWDCCRQNTGDTRYLSVHSIGRAIDLAITQSGGDADNTAGDAVANWLVEHAQEIGVQIVIWDRSSWRAERPAGMKLRPYTGPIPHTDHIHMELSLDGANRRTVFFTSGASGGGATCTPRCDGTRIVNADCGTGDCALYGTTCLADPTPRCGTPGCPRTGAGFICADRNRRVECRDGVVAGVGDCAVYGSYCSTAGVGPTEARCVVSLCVSGPEMVPQPHLACHVTPGHQIDCLATGGIRDIPCPSGQICSVTGGAVHCEAPRAQCPVPAPGAPNDDRTVCLDGTMVARCFNGNVITASACGANGVCSALGGGAHCAQRACVDGEGRARGGDVCTPGGDLARCDAAGTFAEVRPCPAGQACGDVMGAARCAAGARGMDDDDLPGGMATPDAGTPADAGVAMDAAGRADGGSAVDVATAAVDAGDALSGPVVGGGCDCRAAPAGAPSRATVGLFAPLVVLLRRRRRPRRGG